MRVRVLMTVSALMAAGMAAAFLSVGIVRAAVTAGPAPITGALLEGLDKTTARVTQFTAPLGQTVRFGTLAVVVKDCRKRPPEDTPESAAYLDIVEMRPGKASSDKLFSGWMFASSPSVSALEHAVYDVWVVDCSTATGSSSKPG
jgi:hypothetical protein